MVTFSVVIATRNLNWSTAGVASVAAQLTPSDELIVVLPAGATTDAAGAAADCPVRFVHTDGAASVTRSRRIGAEAASKDVVAFIDDDITLENGWFEQLGAAYDEAGVAGVAGRLCDAAQAEDRTGGGGIGRVLADGRVTQNFAVDPGRPVEVDHLPAASLSFRRSVLQAVGGLDDDYPDAGRFAEIEAALQTRRRGGRLLFVPTAVATRRPAEQRADQPTPHPTGRPSIRNQLYLARRSQAMMLARVFGLGPHTNYYLAGVVRNQRVRLIEAVMLTTPYWGRADGSRRPLRRRLEAPIPLGYAIAELGGVVAGMWATVGGRHRRSSRLPQQ
ncbi:MAG TPA: glycosyltransferase [Microbacteriaceae bacterium]